MRLARPIGWIVIGVVIGMAVSRTFGTASAAQTPYKVIQAPRDATGLEGSLNSNATLGWRLRAMDGGFIVFER